MDVKTLTIRLSTKGHGDVTDITPNVINSVMETGLKNGLVNIFSPSSTSALTTIEFESGCISDLNRLFDEIVNPERHYDHNARWGDGNGHSHVRAALLGPSLAVPFREGKLSLGTWQQIIFVDFDNRARQRELVVQVLGV